MCLVTKKAGGILLYHVYRIVGNFGKVLISQLGKFLKIAELKIQIAKFISHQYQDLVRADSGSCKTGNQILPFQLYNSIVDLYAIHNYITQFLYVQISPFPYDLVAAELSRYPNAELVWTQEEPKNMGAWQYVQPRFSTACNHQRTIRYSQ